MTISRQKRKTSEAFQPAKSDQIFVEAGKVKHQPGNTGSAENPDGDLDFFLVAKAAEQVAKWRLGDRFFEPCTCLVNLVPGYILDGSARKKIDLYKLLTN